MKLKNSSLALWIIFIVAIGCNIISQFMLSAILPIINIGLSIAMFVFLILFNVEANKYKNSQYHKIYKTTYILGYVYFAVSLAIGIIAGVLVFSALASQSVIYSGAGFGVSLLFILLSAIGILGVGISFFVFAIKSWNRSKIEIDINQYGESQNYDNQANDFPSRFTDINNQNNSGSSNNQSNNNNY